MKNTIVISREMTSKENIMKNVKYRIVRNTELRPDAPQIPTFKFCDIDVGYTVEVEECQDYTARLIVTDDMMREKGIAIEDLDAAAMENTANDGIIVAPIWNFISKQFDEDDLDVMRNEAVPMLVISTKKAQGGAVAILLPGVRERVSEMLGGNFYILPSSIHEVIAVPETAGEADDLRSMVSSINNDVVEPEDRLSDSVYLYDTGKKAVTIA